MVLLIWKGGDISWQYQLAAAFTRENEGEPKFYQPTISSIFYLYDGYTGTTWIALGQPDGEVAEHDGEGRRVLRIPESGLLSTQSQPMVAAMAKMEFAFYYTKEDGNTNEPIPAIPFNCLTYFLTNNLTDENIKEYGFDPDKIYVNYLGYNPAREIVNSVFKKEIKSQVFRFKVDTLRNLLRFL